MILQSNSREKCTVKLSNPTIQAPLHPADEGLPSFLPTLNAKSLSIEAQFLLHCSLFILTNPESMTLSFKNDDLTFSSICSNSFSHHCCLSWGDDSIFRSLENEERGGNRGSIVDGGAREVGVWNFLGCASYQSEEVLALELVNIDYQYGGDLSLGRY